MKDEILEVVSFLSSPAEGVYGLGAILTSRELNVRSVPLSELLLLQSEKRDPSSLREVLFLKIQSLEEVSLALKAKRSLYQSIVLVGKAAVLEQSDELLNRADCIVRENHEEMCHGA